jgi:hypothetical protein
MTSQRTEVGVFGGTGRGVPREPGPGVIWGSIAAGVRKRGAGGGIRKTGGGAGAMARGYWTGTGTEAMYGRPTQEGQGVSWFAVAIIRLWKAAEG